MQSLTLAAADGGLASMADLPIAAYRTDAQGHILAFNDRAATLWGRRPQIGEQWCGSHRIMDLSGRFMAHSDCPMAVSLKTGVPVTDVTALLETPDGEVRAFRPHPILLRDHESGIIGGVNLLLDVTDGWHALSALADREAWLAGVFDSGVVGLTVFDFEQQKTIKANDYILRLIDATRDDFEAGRRGCYDATPLEYRHLDDAAVEQAQRQGYWDPFEKEYERQDGTRVPVRVSSAPLAGFAGHCVVCVEDLTAQRESERRVRLLQAEVNHLSRLSAMGTMAAILAHEVAQPLSAISNALVAIDKLQGREDATSRNLMKEAVEIARAQSELGNAIIKRIRTFAARDHELWQCFDLQRLIEDAASLALLKCANTRLAVSVTPRARHAHGDAVQIEQVLVNLLKNAAEAMDGRGTVSVEAHLRAGRIEVLVSDDGPGFCDNARARAFEPFSTTKADGTGLGLSVCRSIIEQHGGTIDVMPSDRGGHVRFTLGRAASERPRQLC